MRSGLPDDPEDDDGDRDVVAVRPCGRHVRPAIPLGRVQVEQSRRQAEHHFLSPTVTSHQSPVGGRRSAVGGTG
ncbi:hypothetical protein [Frankia sp. Cppng1_Ct_nod]|uniref:hypothetical protein n=1 Tax=Frankia sp. Cppng1_Ct_nod TaxID=2897162 RepID=UPI001040E386|nr:hypothetical protein [Frankia sp. Cppng1_Ct_nod]